MLFFDEIQDLSKHQAETLVSDPKSLLASVFFGWSDNVHLTQREQEKLLVHVAADVARKRQQRGLKLNYPEALAILTAEILEAARDGKSVAEIMTYGQTILTQADVMDGIAEMIHEVQVEATFPDGTKLVTVHDPIQ